MTVVYAVGGIATLELETVASEPPAVRVSVSGVAATTTFTLTRLCEGETETVPGWRAKQFIDSFVYTDWAAPTNRSVTYNLLAGGSVVASATITLESPYAWLQDPLQPNKCMPFTLRDSTPGMASLDSRSLKELEYRAESSLIGIMGSNRPVAFGGQRSAASGVMHRIRTYTDADAERFLNIIEEAPILLIRTLPGMRGVPALTYLNANVQRQQFTTHLPGGQQEYWTLTGDLLAAVMQAAITGSITYDDVQQLLAGYTYDQVQAKAAATTYLDWQKNPLIFSTL